jgi:hypothetical protein
VSKFEKPEFDTYSGYAEYGYTDPSHGTNVIPFTLIGAVSIDALGSTHPIRGRDAMTALYVIGSNCIKKSQQYKRRV